MGWYATLLSAMPSGGSPNGVEITAGGVSRVHMPRDLDTWCGTQGAGSTAASSGTSRAISNNIEIEFKDAASAAISGAVGIGLFDAASAGNCRWAGYITADGAPVTRAWASGDRVFIDIDSLRVTGPEGMTNDYVNAHLDYWFRGQTAPSVPA